ncbi:hypothetical protein BO94DRAFT_584687 [Aspergillus sclerotioniger CBS 115572]|uniref:Uncharacterized protein n=1 Tax=Aspergillus sclerotioniger CBS 115572 TaxID=1450535 RepID=A0A317WTK0_9EURO|nr:hypothetical protein BO94DRAFT_584687 [Aspergillus sclerotioniger CBS 115572]PWY89425.1 hypothetical protein BO94DRAFT_584687 [Aspergillus sclerotioniger CBS 115572]
MSDFYTRKAFRSIIVCPAPEDFFPFELPRPTTEQHFISIDEKSRTERTTSDSTEMKFITRFGKPIISATEMRCNTPVVHKRSSIESRMAADSGKLPVIVEEETDEQAIEDNKAHLGDMAPTEGEATNTSEQDISDDKVHRNSMTASANKELVITIDDPPAVPEKAHSRIPVPPGENVPKVRNLSSLFKVKIYPVMMRAMTERSKATGVKGRLIERGKASNKEVLLWIAVAMFWMMMHFGTWRSCKAH